MNRKFISNSNCVLKEIFNKDSNLDIVQDFIEGILKIKIEEIYLKPKLEIEEIVDETLGIVNVRIVTAEKETINVGIQIIDGYYIQHKLILYYAQLHSNQVIYEDMVRTITINIIDDEYFETQNYCKVSKIKNFNPNILKNINLGELHILQLPKFKVQTINTKEEAWVQYLKNGKICKDYEKIEKLDSVLDNYWKDEII